MPHASHRHQERRDAEARSAGAEWLPVVYPGFRWSNLKGKGAAKDAIPRLGGEFYWRQIAAAADAGAEMAAAAMFDEVDEGTALFKVTNEPPTEASFATFEGLPADWYLLLTGEGRGSSGASEGRGSSCPLSREAGASRPARLHTAADLCHQ